MGWLRELQAMVHGSARDRGFYDGVKPTPVEISSRLALAHSELSEALECLRDGDMATRVDASGKPCGFGSELADVVIRVMDLAEWLSIDLEREIEDEHTFNKLRPAKHNKEF